MLATALFAGEEAVRHTPEQLDVLAEAGVVDAGALGLVVIIRGMIAGLAGEQVQLPEIPHYAAARLDQVHHADSEFRYCTNFIVTGDGLDGDSFVPGSRRSATRCSWSATRRRSRSTSTPTTTTPRRRCSPTPARSATTTSPTCTSRSPTSGRGSAPGARRWSRSPAATGCGACSRASAPLVVDGGPTLNPPTKDLLAAIEACRADEVVLLPNSATC